MRFTIRNFELMDSLLDGLPKHLNPGGRCLLAYGHVPAIQRLLEQAAARGFTAKILDDRDLDSLPDDFLPGMLIEIKPPLPALTGSAGAATSPPQANPAEPETP